MRPILTGRAYDWVKWFLLTFCPALMALIAGLGALGYIPNAESITAVIALVAAFLGQIVRISYTQYYDAKARALQDELAALREARIGGTDG